MAHADEDVKRFNKRIAVGDPITFLDFYNDRSYHVTRTPARVRGQDGIVFLVGRVGPVKINDCSKGWTTGMPVPIYSAEDTDA